MMLPSAKIACVSALLITSCAGPELGDCDRTTLGGVVSGPNPMPHAGQVKLQSSCAGGRCHASGATGMARFGAPEGLDFNVVPNSTSDSDVSAARRAFGTVSNHVDEIWVEIEDGTMPPPAPAGQGPLNAADKEVIRNWLACGAPVIAAPIAAAADADAWTRIYTQLSGQCIGCHSAATSGAGGGFVFGEMGDACGAYKNVRDVATQSNGVCRDRVLVKPGDPAASVLLQKLNAMNLCGATMPLGSTSPAMPFAANSGPLVNDLQSWIMAGAMPPANCN